MDPNTPKQYDLAVLLDGKKVPMIPFILNTCGHIFLGAIKDLEDCGQELEDNVIKCTINPNNDIDSRMKMTINEKEIQMKAFIQDMIWKTLAGFLSSLKKIPENLLELPLELTIKKI